MLLRVWRVFQACPHPAHAKTSSLPWAIFIFTLFSERDVLTPLLVKSGPPTPTRALSAARPSMSDDKDDTNTASGTQTPKASSTGAQLPAAKGRLTIKILEAAGLRKCKEPHLVAVFQRSELISGGPITYLDKDEPSTAATLMMGGISIQRQSSDPGRAMAIPMRSRQSSNTSVGDYGAFRNRTKQSFTHPKWDARAVL